VKTVPGRASVSLTLAVGKSIISVTTQALMINSFYAEADLLCKHVKYKDSNKKTVLWIT
jgi:hypothetical protein